MTTAARPTFDTARARDANNPTLQYSSRDLASHTKLKYRQSGQNNEADVASLDLKQQLLEAENKHFSTKNNTESNIMLINQSESYNKLDDKHKLLLLKATEDDNSDNEESETESNSINKPDILADQDLRSDHPSEDDDSEEEDETLELMRELEKIKQERKLERQKQEKQKREQKEKESEINILYNNPLLNQENNDDYENNEVDFTVKKNWDDDVIFKNQARGVKQDTNSNSSGQKRFINDMLRSDFHKKFMYKYIR